MANSPVVQHYMALFNTIDKYLDQYIQTDGFMPFNEKLKHIIKAQIPMSSLISLYEQQLKLFGEIRNHLVHSFKLDGATYLLPTHDAICELSHIVTLLTKPPTCHSLFDKSVYMVSPGDILLDVMTKMKQNSIEHVPVVDDSGYIFSLSYVLICDRIISHPDINIKNHINIKQLLDEKTDIDLFPRHQRGYQYQCISQTTTIYEAEQLFESYRHSLGALYITQDGLTHQDISGMITASDVTTLFKQL